MRRDRHTSHMEVVILFVILLLAGVASVLGPDSHDYDANDRRGWWPGHR